MDNSDSWKVARRGHRAQLSSEKEAHGKTNWDRAATGQGCSNRESRRCAHWKSSRKSEFHERARVDRIGHRASEPGTIVSARALENASKTFRGLKT